tara:strand:- start:8415 stop:9746 length:1332 start_codon:yes stop_codon:yes gene_type:complete
MIYFSSAEQAVADSIQKLKQFTYDKMQTERDMCIDYYTYNNTEKYVTEFFGGSLQREVPLYTNNLTKRLINRISLVYKDGPDRLVTSDSYPDLIEDKNYAMKKIERLHNLVGTVAMCCKWYGDKFYYHPLIEFEPIMNPDNPMEVMAIIHPVPKTSGSWYQKQNEDEFVYWDKDQHFRFDAWGKRTSINEDDVNPYGILPFVFIQPNTQIDEFWNDGAKDVALGNKQIDIAMTMLQHHIRSAGGQFVIEGMVDSSNIELGLNKVVLLENGEMSNISNQTNITDIIEGIKFQMQNIAMNHHLSFDFGLSGSKSGVALKIENLELLEAREDDVEKFRKVEKELYEIERAVGEAEGAGLLPEDFSIDYKEVEFPDYEQEMKEWDWKFQHGIADVADYLMSKDPDGFPTREDAEKHIAERQMSANSVRKLADTEDNMFLTKGKPNAE